MKKIAEQTEILYGNGNTIWKFQNSRRSFAVN